MCCIPEVVVLLCFAYRSPPSQLEPVISALCAPYVGRPWPNLDMGHIFVVAWLCTTAGGLLRVACHRYLGHYFAYQLAVREDHKLITSGPYSVVRHPSYTGMLLSVLGILVMSLGRGSWAQECGAMEHPLGKLVLSVWAIQLVALVAATMHRAGVEDGVLREQFGVQWEQWSKSTRYKMIPGIF